MKILRSFWKKYKKIMEGITGVIFSLIIYFLGIGLGSFFSLLRKKNNDGKSYWKNFEMKTNYKEMF